jgi:hypothetical protein
MLPYSFSQILICTPANPYDPNEGLERLHDDGLTLRWNLSTSGGTGASSVRSQGSRVRDREHTPERRVQET